LIYNGIEAKDFTIDETALRSETGYFQEDFIVLLPALFYAEKGHLNFLDSFRQMNESLNPAVKILFAGNGPLENQVKEKVKELGLEHTIIFLGFMPHMEKYYQLANLIILPSQKEFLPYAILEAMSYSKPVLATDTGSINEMIEQKVNGELFSLNDLASLWRRINYYSYNADELKPMGYNSGKILAEKFSLKQMITRTEELYDKLFYTS
jgi:glycosyltransferase involved in cell wall biosynthesis